MLKATRMRRMLGRALTVCSLSVLSSCLLVENVAAQTDCSAEIAEIDRRIATGNYSAQNVQLATQLKASLVQMCGFMDEGTRAAMMEGLEKILPTRSEQEQRAERQGRARSDEQKALRETRKHEETALAAAQPAIAPVIKAPPTGRSVAARILDRDEDMLRLSITDWDTYKGKARILYVTTPSRTQLGRPDWRVYVYVVEITPEGNATQYMVTSKQAMDNRAVALRRGHDEILFERTANERSGDSTLERWSISGGRQLSSVPTPKPAWSDGSTWPWQPFRVATSDGNVLFVAGKKGRGGALAVGWFEAAPDGAVLGMGSLASADEDLSASHFFRTSNGGGGVVLTVTAKNNAGLQSRSSSAVIQTMARATIFSETRALIVANDAKSAWESDALTRMLVWEASSSVPQTPSMSEIMKQQQEQMRLRTQLESQTHANRVIDSIDIGLESVPMIRQMTDGFGALATVTADRHLKPPIHGAYFLRIGDDGVVETAYLNPMAEALEVDFDILAISPGDDVYLYGKPMGQEDRSYVVKLDKKGDVLAYGRAAPHHDKSVVIEGMTADETGVWLYGTQTPVGAHQRFWFERLAFQ